MSHEQEDHENDAFLWENQSWVNLSNDTSDNSGGEKAVSLPEVREEKEKKRGRGASKKGKGEKGEKKEGEETPDHEIHIWTERERRKKMRNMFSNLHSLLPQLPPKADKSTIVDEAVNYIKTLQSTFQRLQKQKLERLQGGPSTNSLPFEPSVAVAATSRLAMLSTRETFMADQVSSMNNNNNNNNNNSINNAMRTSTTLSASASHLPVMIQTWTSSNVVLNICGNDAQFAVYASKRPGLFTTICCVLEKYKLEVLSAHISSDVDRSVYMIQAHLANGAKDQFPETITVEEIYKQAAGEILLWVSS
ncbi:hypothetical protein BVRB_9g216190 [Beta vulgaris subsp. vulgaris]|uniref:transcription factor bHLH95 n=1 Tax=Beta vulgaris subsp. vulgaris TaxID=3555 RepID=UPI00053FBF59|nr:transcription factor bHLH95 [Beta vulgaris subsp. vulgaris]KMT01625.1 hypothetical protein BVRB_9g216190 [Beta vulgaris subsp. vulgaris]